MIRILLLLVLFLPIILSIVFQEPLILLDMPVSILLVGLTIRFEETQPVPNDLN